MSTQVTRPRLSRGAVGKEICPHCGQRLLTRQAVERLNESERELEERLAAAVRTIVAELSTTPVEPLLEDGAGNPPAHLPDAVNAAEQRALRLVFRQF